MTPSPPSSAPPPAHDGGVLAIDCAALAQNYQIMAKKSGAAKCASVVKADAYGLGLNPVARTLREAGCQQFFVAQAQEGAALRGIIADAEIYVLNGLMPHAEDFYAAHRLIPCLTNREQIAAMRASDLTKAALYLDSGFNRLGLSLADVMSLSYQDFDGFELALIMSHLACADNPTHKMNRAQLETFHTMRAILPPAPASLANSAGVLLGRDYHFDMTRCGIALYGGSPTGNPQNAFHNVVSLYAPILAIRNIDQGDTLGYGAEFAAAAPMQIAIIAAGYGDGIARNIGRTSPPFINAYIEGHPTPIIGRISMDMLAIDISTLAATPALGTQVELIGTHAQIDQIAAQSNTISYELLTQLGKRYLRHYKDST